MDLEIRSSRQKIDGIARAELRGGSRYLCLYQMKATIKNILENAKHIKNKKIQINGWIQSVRRQKENTFLQLNDGSCLKGIQATFLTTNTLNGSIQEPFLTTKMATGDPAISKLPTGSLDIAKLHTGACVSLEGTIQLLQGRKQDCELVVEKLNILGSADPNTYPLHKGRIPLDHLRQFPHLRQKSNTFSAVWRIRSGLMEALAQFFKSQEFINVQPPILTSSDCEGGGEAFQVLTSSPSKQDDHFFNRPVFTTVSSQLHLEFLASGMSRVYTIGPCFRAEPSNSTRHLAEFWMLEAEIAFITDLDHLVDFIEAQIKFVIKYLLDYHAEDLQFFNQFIEKGLVEKLTKMVDEPFARITYTDAIDALLKVKDKEWSHPIKHGHALQSEHEKYLAEEIYKGPVFITQYPQPLKPFYMKLNTTSGMAECTDLVFPKWGEVVGGSLREDNTQVMISNLEKYGIEQSDYEWYLDLRRWGSFPHGGYGMGVERLLGVVTGITNIRDLIPVPRYMGHCAM